MGSTFGTAINCIDGRVQIPVIEWVKKNFPVDHVDLITIQGADKVVALSEKHCILVREKTEFSVKRHDSRVVAICGHHDCAGNPVSDEKHMEYIKQAVGRIKSWELGVEVIGLWVNDKWEVERIV